MINRCVHYQYSAWSWVYWCRDPHDILCLAMKQMDIRYGIPNFIINYTTSGLWNPNIDFFYYSHWGLSLVVTVIILEILSNVHLLFQYLFSHTVGSLGHLWTYFYDLSFHFDSNFKYVPDLGQHCARRCFSTNTWRLLIINTHLALTIQLKMCPRPDDVIQNGWWDLWEFSTVLQALTHCGLVTPYDSTHLGQHWLR